jgi:hypothetical protein
LGPGVCRELGAELIKRPEAMLASLAIFRRGSFGDGPLIGAWGPSGGQESSAGKQVWASLQIVLCEWRWLELPLLRMTRGVAQPCEGSSETQPLGADWQLHYPWVQSDQKSSLPALTLRLLLHAPLMEYPALVESGLLK